jgi:alpha-tubulin suppressor-like RCC1 family protein
MIKDILLNVSRSYTPYIPTTELWGNGNTAWGQLNNSISEGFFRDVVSGTTWSVVSVGASHTMAVKTDGTLWGWGRNLDGQLGTNDSVSRSSPVQIGTLNTWSNVKAGNAETIAIRTNGTLWAWGNNISSQIGDGTTINRSSPVQIGTLTNWSSFVAPNASSNKHSIGITSDGKLWGWGSDANGGLSIYPPASELAIVNYPQNWANGTTTVGNNATITMIKTDGTLWGWGSETDGMLWTTGSFVFKSSPVQLGTLTNWSKVFSGGNHTVAIKTDGTLWGWGFNVDGSIGQGTVNFTFSSPIQIGNLNSWTEISAGNSFTMAIRNTGTLWSWGTNTSGQLGSGVTTSRSSPVQIGAQTDWSKISSGASFTMAIKTTGTLWGWGGNTAGQLGIGTNTNRSSPVQIGTLSNWSQISAGMSYTMAIKTDGTLWGWGENNFGQLGIGVTGNISSPVQIGTLTNWSSVFSGGGHVMAIKTDGTLWTWGSNNGGVFGIGDTISRSSPIQVGVLTNWNKPVLGRMTGYRYTLVINNSNQLYGAGESPYSLRQVIYSVPTQLGSTNDWSNAAICSNSTLAIKYDGTLWSWGSNTNGQLGDGTSISKISPVQIGTLTNWSSVFSGGAHVMSIKTDGTLWSWGSDSNGILGLSTNFVNRSSPVQIGTLNSWITTGLSGTNSFAIRNDNTLWLWGSINTPLSTQTGSPGGSNNQSSPVQIGTLNSWSQVSSGGTGNVVHAIDTTSRLQSIGPTTGTDLRSGINWDYVSPNQIGNITQWKMTSAGFSHTMAISSSGALWAWGINSIGQLGDNSIINKNSPVQIGTRTDWNVVESGALVTYAITNNNVLFAWGEASSGKLGINNDIVSRSSPVQVGVFTDWSSISAKGDNSAAAIRSNNTLWTWGSDNFIGTLGQNVSNVNRSVPTQVGTLTNWAKVSAGDQGHMLAVKTDGTLWGWGRNTSGQVGDGTAVNRSSPVQIGTLTNWHSVETGYLRSFGIKTDGTLWFWGNASDTLAGTNRNTYVPNKIPTDRSFKSISTGGTDFTIALATDNSIWSWGPNSFGQLGNGTITTRSSPVQIGTLSNWSQISAGSSYTMAIQTNGTLWAWGNNANGRLGTGNTTSYSSPVQVGTLNNWSKIDASFSHTMAVKTDGTLWTWGSNNNGRLGDNTTSFRSSPVQIGTLNNWSLVSAGDAHSVSIKTDGTLWGWGLNSSGQLGDGTVVTRSSPVQIGTLNNWSKIAAGITYAMAIKTDGTLWGWGANGNGQLGIGVTTNRSSPVQIGTLNNWSEVYITNTDFQVTTLAIQNNGYVWGWGTGNYQFGTANVISRSSPIQITSIPTFASASLGQYVVIGLQNDGSLWSWGLSNSGNLGYDQNFNINRSSPIQLGNDTDWLNAVISNSQSGLNNNEDSTVVVKSNNTVWVWGNNNFGQLGTGDKISRSLITQIGTQYSWISGSVGNRHSMIIRNY